MSRVAPGRGPGPGWPVWLWPAETGIRVPRQLRPSRIPRSPSPKSRARVTGRPTGSLPLRKPPDVAGGCDDVQRREIVSTHRWEAGREIHHIEAVAKPSPAAESLSGAGSAAESLSGRHSRRRPAGGRGRPRRRRRRRSRVSPHSTPRPPVNAGSLGYSASFCALAPRGSPRKLSSSPSKSRASLGSAYWRISTRPRFFAARATAARATLVTRSQPHRSARHASRTYRGVCPRQFMLDTHARQD